MSCSASGKRPTAAPELILGRVDIDGFALITAETIGQAAGIARGARRSGMGGSTIVCPLLPRVASGWSRCR